jgi:hypothetical protein
VAVSLFHASVTSTIYEEAQPDLLHNAGKPASFQSPYAAQRGRLHSFGKMKIITIVAAILLLAGCASYTDLNHGDESAFGGGYKDSEVAPGLFFISATTGTAPWANLSGARKVFLRRATELCGAGNFTVVESEESAYEAFQTPGFGKHIISSVWGYVLAKGSPVTEVEARNIIRRRDNRDPANPAFPHGK